MIVSYLLIMGMSNCGRRLLWWQQMTLWFKQCARAVMQQRIFY